MSFLQHPLHHCPVIIGAGLAGLMTALELAPMKVLVLSAAPLGEEAASAWAQGGLSAAIGSDDSIDLHVADTLAAGDGLCDPAVVRSILREAPGLVGRLCDLGARFDLKANGEIGFGLEAGHSRHRIVHAHGDGSGREILRAVIEAVRRTPSITVMEKTAATRLIIRDGAVAGVLARGENGEPFLIRTSRVIIATGGAGALYAHSTNPSGSIGHGMMLAARAGAALADMEFVQFHPTALAVGRDPMPLVSEAVRGEGAILIDENGYRFMENQGRAELEPRDVVSRAVWRHMMAGRQVYLDARTCLGSKFSKKFPVIAQSCLDAGIDPATQPIPIRPAAHYVMGGIATDLDGRSSIPGLWAAGEAASTGLHGANRLASNSLLEAAVMGQFVARDVAGISANRVAPLASITLPPAPKAKHVREILAQNAFVLRDKEGLTSAITDLLPLAQATDQESDPASLALMMTVAMHQREESRGGHARTDFPQKRDDLAKRQSLTLDQVLRQAREIATMPMKIRTTGQSSQR